MGKDQGHVRDVLNSWRYMRVTLTIDRHRRLAENVKDDRDIMRREIPRHIDVFLEQSEIQAPRVDVANLTDVARFDDLHHLLNRAKSKETCGRPSASTPAGRRSRSAPRTPPKTKPSASR